MGWLWGRSGLGMVGEEKHQTHQSRNSELQHATMALIKALVSKAATQCRCQHDYICTSGSAVTRDRDPCRPWFVWAAGQNIFIRHLA